MPQFRPTIILSLMFLFLIPAVASAQFAGGDGSRENPWLVSTAEELQAISGHLNEHFRLSADIDLTFYPWQPIAYLAGSCGSPFSGSLDGGGYRIRGMSIHMPGSGQVGLFSCMVDALVTSLVLEGVDITAGTSTGALAGRAWRSVITNVAANGLVRGDDYTGGLVGDAEATVISNSHFSGFVNGASRTGGLVGFLQDDAPYPSQIIDSYASATVEAPDADNVGGLVGYARHSIITRSYAQGTVMGTASVGGFAGNSWVSSIIDSFWDKDRAGPVPGLGYSIEGVEGVTGLHTFEMQDSPRFLAALWNYESIWVLGGGSEPGHLWLAGHPSNSAPVLRAPIADQQLDLYATVDLDTSAYFLDPEGGELTFSAAVAAEESLPAGLNIDPETGVISGMAMALQEVEIQVTATESGGRSSTTSFDLIVMPIFDGGEGTATAPWQISEAEQLNAVRYNLAAHYELLADIDLDQAPWNTGAGWEPIGILNDGFTGSFNGKGFSISNLLIDRPDSDEVGLFGEIDEAEISNLVLESVDITGRDSTGGLTGYAWKSSISNVRVSGTVTGQILADEPGVGSVGGLAGYAGGSTIHQSQFLGNVLAEDFTGGLVGKLAAGDGTISSVTESLALGSVSGDARVGGLAGIVDGGSTISDSYARGNVSGSQYVGGLAGEVLAGSSLNKTFFIGPISSSDISGALAGNIEGSVSNSFWNADLSDLPGAGEAVDGGLSNSSGESTTNLLDPALFADAGWDMLTVWQTGGGSPYHAWSGPIDFSLPPVLNVALADQHLLLDQAWVLDLKNHFVDPDGETLSFAAAGLPEGLAINAETGVVSGTPAELGTFTVNVTATDPGDAGSTSSISMTIRNFSGGDGSSDSPWEISTPAQLHALRDELDAHFVLAGDIDMDVAPWNSGAGWNPVGSQETPFTGSLDGNGHTISNLLIDLEQDYAGLFAYAIGAEFSNIRLQAVNVTGSNYVGGLLGYAHGSDISNSYVHGAVSGGLYVGGVAGYISQTSLSRSHAIAAVTAEEAAGGLLGFASASSIISDSFARGSVTASQIAGGLVGTLHASQMTSSYAINTVSGDFAFALVGSGYDESAVSNSYWGAELMSWLDGTGAGVTSTGNDGRTLTELQAADTFSGIWDFDLVWAIDEGSSYPYHQWSGPLTVNSAPVLKFMVTGELAQLRLNQAMEGDLHTLFIDPDRDVLSFSSIGLPEGLTLEGSILSGSSADVGIHELTLTAEDPSGAVISVQLTLQVLPFEAGAGTEGDPWQIETATQLHAIRENPAAHYQLSADIDLGGSPWSDDAGWEPIGDWENPFTGSFDGNAHVIDGLTINRPGEARVGLFGRTDGVVIHDVILRNVSVIGFEHAGALVGDLHESSLSRVSASGDIGAVDTRAGGLAGRAYFSTLHSSYFSGQVMAVEGFAGGLAGELGFESAITDSHVQASIEGSTSVGGLAGSVDNSTISNSLSEASVSGETEVGALAGTLMSGVISHSYWDEDLAIDHGVIGAGSGDTGTSTALNEAALQDVESFPSWDFSSAWFIHQALNNGRPILHWQQPTHIPPFFSVFTDPVASTAEDTSISFDFPEMADLSNAQGSDAALSGFMVKSLTAGSLSIGGAAFDADSNALVSGDLQLVWMPPADAYGLLPAFTAVAVDAEGAQSRIAVTAMVSVTAVNDAPRLLTTIPDQAGAQAAAFEVDISGYFDDVEGDVLSYAATGLPEGLGIDSEGVISGTPDNAVALGSPFTITITVTDPNESSVSDSFELLINNVNDAPEVSGEIPDQQVKVGEEFHLDVAAYFTDIDEETLRYAATGLPAELSLGVDGVIRGTPPAAGRHEVTVTASDGDEEHVSDTFLISALSFGRGAGTEENPWQVSSAALLNEMRYALDGHFALTADIDLGGDDPEGPFWNGGAGWMPVGDIDSPFAGSLSGGGHVISGLYINRDFEDNVGMFGYTLDAQLSRLGVEALSVQGNAYVSMLAAYAKDTDINGVYVSGELRGMMYLGGIAGSLEGGAISHSYSRVHVIDAFFFSGVLAGLVSEGAGVLGSYAAGEANGSSFIGALLGGFQMTAAELSDSFWLEPLDEMQTAIGFDETATQMPIMLSPNDMRSRSSFPAWDFNRIWALKASLNDGFPVLRWQLPPVAPAPGNVISSPVAGRTLNGNITVTSGGVINGGNISGTVNNSGLLTGNLNLGANTRIVGGAVSGNVVGSSQSPARITGAQISGEARLENVLIGPGTVLDSDVQIGPNVRFDSNSLIPPGLDLTAALNKLQWIDGDAREVVDLQGDVVSDAEESLSLIQAIQQLNEFEPAGNQILQRSDNGELYVEVGGSSNAVLPISISQAVPDEPEGVSINEDGDIVFVTVNRRVVISHPVLNEGLAFQQQAEMMGLQLGFDNRTNLVLTEQGGSMVPGSVTGRSVSALSEPAFYFVGRPDVSAVPAYRGNTPGLVSYLVPGLTGIEAVSILFESGDGTLMQQDIAPVPADWFALKAVLQQIPDASEVRIDLQGIISMRLSGVPVRARVDYQVWQDAEATGEMRYEDAGDLNGDGIGDFMLFYPNGDRQGLYLYP